VALRHLQAQLSCCMVSRVRLVWTVVGVGLASACGARTELLAPEIPDVSDVEIDVRDAMVEEDALEEDVLPPIDQFNDSPPPTDCPDAGATLVYIITAQNDLFSFYPPSLAFTKIGTVACPAMKGATPYSMAVNHLGTAYSVFTDGTLWQVDTANAACTATSYVPSVMGTPFFNFGMGYAGDAMGESLYVADANFGADSQGLATIDTMSFARSFIADFNPSLPRCELTGTGNGRLFAFCLNLSGSGSILAEVDRTNANVIAENDLSVGSPNDAFAYAFWGGEFWIFSGPSTTTVTQYDPGTQTETTVATMTSTIVGAGVSTCAPQ
jgi:hypothetical protein